MGYTAGVLAAIIAALVFPGAFAEFAGVSGPRLIPPLFQLVMFGMGLTLTIGDFARVARMPRAAIVGALLQFTVMPCTGYAVAHLLDLPPTLTAGVVLVGSCSGGAASNVVTYLARGNVALSVTMTAFSTLLAPLATPAAVKLLAGQAVAASFAAMMLSILSTIVAPVAAGCAVSTLFPRLQAKLQRSAPAACMAALCVTIAIGTATSRDRLLDATLSIALAAVLHNAAGFLFGYFGARFSRLDESASRTVSIEVGFQNAGMAVVMAFGTLNNPEAALPAVVFGAWMNISGAALAAWWSRRPVEEIQAREAAA
jgi:BASS family bile acid:Na+ symporter